MKYPPDEYAMKFMASRIRPKKEIFLVFLVSIHICLISSPVAFGEHFRDIRPDSDLKFEHITIEQGLSHGVVYSITQDQQGFMWFSGEGGLVKYDGYNFTVYQHDPLNPNSLSNSSISYVLLDNDGILWCATWGGGVNKVDPRTETFSHYRHVPDDPHSLSDDRVQVIYQDTSGIFWFGTFRGGLNRFDPKTEKITVYRHDPNDPQSLSHDRVWAITEDQTGNFWVATSDGLNKLDRSTGKFTHYQHDPDNPKSLSNNRIRWLYVDSEGTLWVSTNQGFNQFHAEDETFTRYLHDPDDPTSLSHNKTYKVWEDQEHRLWISANATDVAGLNLFDRQQNIFIHFKHDPNNPNSITHNDIRTIFEDRSGMLWIGTRGGGVNKLDLKPKKFTAVIPDPNNPNSLRAVSVNTFYEDRSGYLWIGTSGGGLNKYDPLHDTYTYYVPDNSPISDRTILSIHEDHSGRFWLGTNAGGLNLFDPATEQFIQFTHDPAKPNSLSDNRVISLYEDSVGRLWIGTGKGLNLFQQDKQTFMHMTDFPEAPQELSQNGINSILEDHTGTLWFGTWAGGLHALRFENNAAAFAIYQHNAEDPHSLSNDVVTTIFEDRNNTLWIGTRGGLNKLVLSEFEGVAPHSQRFIHYFEQDGLSDNEIVGIQEDDNGYLWISTINGLSKFDPASGTFRNYDFSDGLQSNEFKVGAAYKSQRGEMFFGGFNGFSHFYPKQVQDNPHIPPVLITDFRIFDQPIDLEQSVTMLRTIELSYQDDFFSFEFAALDYTNPQKNKYAYMLKGFDKDWIYSGSRRYVSYTNLDPGEYIFRVKASNNDGIWNEAGTSIRIIIPPPFWETSWFRLIVALCILGLVWAAYRIRIRTIQKQKELLEIQVQERTAEIEAQKVELKNTLDNLKKTQTQLVQSEKMAALGQLVSGIAHEINTPAGAIISALDQVDQVYVPLLAKINTTFERLSPELRHLYVLGCQDILTTDKKISTQERRALAKNIRNLFTERGIDTSHNFCNKLAKIRMKVDDIRKLFPLFNSPESQEIVDSLYLLGVSQIHIRDAKSSITQITQLVNALKYYSHHDQGAFVETNLQEDLDNTLVILHSTFTKDIKVYKEYEPLPLFTCYAAQLNQVWTNLILNAYQAMKENGEIYLRLKRFGDNTLSVEVEDTGLGIPDEILPRIFEPYFTTKSDKDKRIGLGLSICKQVVEQHQGRIEVVSSQPGKTCFRVVLPLNVEYKIS